MLLCLSSLHWSLKKHEAFAVVSPVLVQRDALAYTSLTQPTVVSAASELHYATIARTYT